MAKRPVRVTTPVPTVEEVIKTYRIPVRRAKKVLAMIDEIIARRKRAEAAPVTTQHPRLKRRRKP